jgi:hypothetical protein
MSIAGNIYLNKLIMRPIFFSIFLTFALPFNLFAQEALKSAEEDYYDFLSLQGLAERPTLNYRTLSDSVWRVDADAVHPWQGLNLASCFTFAEGLFSLRIYGPELFQSYNTAAPYGQNDGALWQGRGYNASFTAGVRLLAGNDRFGRVEATLKPQVSFSQNAAFDYIAPNAAYAGFTGKAADYGYYGVASIDAPQRFGNDPFFTFDWGDSEIRYTWKTLTAGFGTQTIWLGPAQLNPIIHSNNAASYPKLDIGLRRQHVTLPWLGWYIGDVEARAWWGYLSESDYFDNDASNDHNLITGLSVAYAFPGLLKGLSVGLNRTMLSKWDAMNADAIFTLLWPFMSNSAGHDENDQRASVTVDYLLPAAGMNVYFEWGRNDFSPTFDHVIRYPFHTEAYTLGIKKSVSFTNTLKGELLLEVSDIESSRDYELFGATTFYAHHIITQGYTNQGQWLGAGIGTGGDSQYLGFKLYYPKGYGEIFVQRRNPDLDYTWFIDSAKYPQQEYPYRAERNIRAFLDFGISGLYMINDNIQVAGSLVFRDEHNPLNTVDPSSENSIHRYGVHISASVKYVF